MQVKEIVLRSDLKKYKSAFSGLNVCITGDFMIQDTNGKSLSKERIKEVLELGGCHFHESLQDDTQLLVAANPNVFTGIVEEAMQMNIYVMGEDEFWELNTGIYKYRISTLKRIM